MNEILYLAFTLPHLTRSWELFDRHAIGVVVPGDDHLPRTRWWSRALISALAPMTVAVLLPDPEDVLRGTFRLGVVRHGKSPMLSTKILCEQPIAIVRWRESTLAFATDPSGRHERRLKLHGIQSLASAEADGILVASI